MNEHWEPVGPLELVGYEKLTDHGLALPVFGRSPDANLFFTARSSTPGEAGGRIAGFDVYDPDRRWNVYLFSKFERRALASLGLMSFYGKALPTSEPPKRFGALSRRSAPALRSTLL